MESKASKALVISLPTADRQTAFTFYRDALGLATFGDQLGGDGLPEPLQFAVNDGVRIMLVPTGGFGWVLDGRAIAPGDSSECVLSRAVDTDADVDSTVERARAAGAEVVGPPERRPWGYVGTFADPDGHVWMIRSEQEPA